MNPKNVQNQAPNVPPTAPGGSLGQATPMGPSRPAGKAVGTPSSKKTWWWVLLAVIIIAVVWWFVRGNDASVPAIVEADAVLIADQLPNEEAVAVAYAKLSQPGYVSVYAEAEGERALIGVSDLLSAGEHRNVVVRRSAAPAADSVERVIAQIVHDDGDETFDAAVDVVAQNDGEPADADAVIDASLTETEEDLTTLIADEGYTIALEAEDIDGEDDDVIGDSDGGAAGTVPAGISEIVVSRSADLSARGKILAGETVIDEFDVVLEEYSNITPVLEYVMDAYGADDPTLTYQSVLGMVTFDDVSRPAEPTATPAEEASSEGEEEPQG